MTHSQILTFSCPDRVGIVHAVTGVLATHGGNITEAAQYNDPDTQRFFMRVQFLLPAAEARAALHTGLATLAATSWWCRGVKIIGATAHDVTAVLDEGPIIEQDITRVDHANDVAQLSAMGRDVESAVLARAVLWHAHHRVLLNGHKTVVFK